MPPVWYSYAYHVEVDWVNHPRWGRRPLIRHVPYCNFDARRVIDSVFNYIYRSIIPKLANPVWPGGEAVTLANCLTGKANARVEVSCNVDCNPLIGGWTNTLGGNKFGLCDSVLPPFSAALTKVAVFHELVHTCGGEDLDAWALSYYLFKNSGAWLPPSSVFSDFCKITQSFGLRSGKFVSWNSITGTVNVRVRIPNGSYSVTQPPIISLDPGWIYPCP